LLICVGGGGFEDLAQVMASLEMLAELKREWEIGDLHVVARMR